MDNKQLTCVDLFSGAGGLSKGFMDAGYNVLMGVDFDDAALKTFKANYGESDALKLDLFDHSNIISPDYPVRIIRRQERNASLRPLMRSMF